jgi:hypothetical protein
MPDRRTYGFNRDDATELVNSIGSRESWYPEIRPRGVTRHLQVILTTDLFAAVNTKRDPSTATARILVKKPDGDLTLSTRSITVVNRFQHISVDAGTYAKAEWIDGEWQLYAADCAAGDSSGSA